MPGGRFAEHMRERPLVSCVLLIQVKSRWVERRQVQDDRILHVCPHGSTWGQQTGRTNIDVVMCFRLETCDLG